MKILFVCTGNTCRSSMAAALARHLLAERSWGPEEFLVASAGIAAVEGEPASREAIQALAEMGVDLRGHRAAGLTAEDLAQADLVLTMTAWHRRHVQELHPGEAHKVFTLADYARTEGDIPDPIGQPLQSYRATALRLKDLIDKALDRLEKEQ
ncbi:MAG: low molecular weight protein arginine phosphatase [Pelotomaculum sp.]|jgi:protein-tyrosine-phosphatase